MSNTVKKIKIVIIASICAIVASCSSGGSGSTEGLNITGRWLGQLNESANLVYDVIFDFSQVDTVGVPGNPQQSQVIFSFSVTGLSAANGGGQDICSGATLSGGTLTISAAANPATLFGDGFNAVVISNRIQGQAVIDDFDDVEFIDANGDTQTVECSFGGPINLRRG